MKSNRVDIPVDEGRTLVAGGEAFFFTRKMVE